MGGVGDLCKRKNTVITQPGRENHAQLHTDAQLAMARAEKRWASASCELVSNRSNDLIPPFLTIRSCSSSAAGCADRGGYHGGGLVCECGLELALKLVGGMTGPWRKGVGGKMELTVRREVSDAEGHLLLLAGTPDAPPLCD